MSTIKTDCENSVYSSINTYTSHYDSYMYSWRTCNHYTYDMSTATCDIDYVWFYPSCQFSCGGNNFYEGYVRGGGCTSGYRCNSYCATMLNSINAEKPWYDSYIVTNCPDYEMRQNVWEMLFT